MTPARFRERIAYRRWQAAVAERDAVDRYDPARPALEAEAKRLERVWGAWWTHNAREESTR